MQAWLASHVRAARVETDIVFLDIGADAYLCLAGAADDLRLSPRGGVEPSYTALIADLVEAGLLTDRPQHLIQPLAPAIGGGLVAPAAAVTLRAFASAVRVNRQAARAIAGLTFQEVLALAGRLDPTALMAPTPALLAESARFSRMAPWLPQAGLCLMRSLQQRLYLSRRGHAAAWVFGVRTWPFEAHCWLQAGDIVLDDDPAHAAGFTPILVV